MRSGLRQVRQYRRFIAPVLAPFGFLAGLVTCFAPSKTRRVRWSYNILYRPLLRQVLHGTEGMTLPDPHLQSGRDGAGDVKFDDMTGKKPAVQMSVEEVKREPEHGVFSRTNTDRTMVASEPEVSGVRQLRGGSSKVERAE
jgi:hypothetical protein